MRSVILMVLVMGAVARPAAADPPKCTPTDGESYRGTLLLLDGLTAGMLAAAYYRAFPAEVALPTYLLGAPMVHHSHGRCDRAGASLAARTLLPSLGGGIARYTNDRYVAAGLVAGAVLASALDIGFLGRAEPVVAPTAGGSFVGVTVAF